ncbi:putative Cyclic di-GMP phosphodiesterase PA4108 [Gammaproteobacteria bacterium]
MDNHTIIPQQLRVGLYVHLDIPWMEHPFFTNSFKIKDENQINTLLRLRLSSLRYEPGRSDCAPLPRPAILPIPPPEDESAFEDPLWAEKKARIEYLKEQRIATHRCENHYTDAVAGIRKLLGSLMADPEGSMTLARDLVSGLSRELSAQDQITLQLLNIKERTANTFQHSIHVTMISLLVGRNLALSPLDLQLLGLGALFHDLGHLKVPTPILRKKESLTSGEKAIYERHPLYGMEIANKLPVFPPDVVEIIANHHEFIDGTGFPRGLRGDRISNWAQVVAIANVYDNYCNRPDPKASLSPHEAVSLMYSRERGRYHISVLNAFIASLGIYPPGTIVRLTDGRISSVVSINKQQLLRPRVLVFDPQIPKTEALILDLSEEDVAIERSLRHQDLSPQVTGYFNLTERS